MALEANEAERIYVEILLGIPRSESLVRMRPEVERFWDELSAEIAQMRADGKGFLVPNEFPDVLPTKETEVRFNPQQPRAPDGKWTSGGGGAMAGDTGGDTPSGGGGSSGGGSKVEIDEDVEGMAHSEDFMYVEVADGVLTEEQGDYIDSLDMTTRTDISTYTGSGYRTTNQALRGAPPPPLSEAAQAAGLARGASINAAIAGAPPLEGGVITYRGVSVKALGVESAADIDNVIGSTFTDKGISSTSLNRATSVEFKKMERGEAVIMEMRVPAGSKTLYVEPMTHATGEFEMLLPSGTQYTIVGRRGNNIVVDVKTP